MCFSLIAVFEPPETFDQIWSEKEPRSGSFSKSEAEVIFLF